MALYLIGDVQGCDAALAQLLQKIDFSPSRDTLYLLGDLVNRGPHSLAVLRRLMQLDSAAQCLLGNHDLHLLALWQGVRKPRHETAQDVLAAADRDALLDWLRHQHLAVHAHGWLMVHAGVLPQWDLAKTLELAHEVEQMLKSQDLAQALRNMYGNTPTQWSDQLAGEDRLRVIVNALTRLRFCTPDGHMEFDTTGKTHETPEEYLPWFEVPGRKTAGIPIAFGHWSGLDSAIVRATHHDLLPLDTGCVWGGCLSAARLDQRTQTSAFELISVRCSRNS